MYTVHYFYTLIQYRDISLKAERLRGTIKQLCPHLPDHLKQTVADGECSPDSKNTIHSDAKHNSKATTTTIPNKLRPLNRFHVQGWNYFDALALYEDNSLSPRKPLKTYRYYLLELQKALLEAVKAANRHHPVKIKFKQLLNGYVRHNALEGSDYIIDAEFVEVRNPKKHLSKRVHLVRPLGDYILQATKTDISETVHIVVPLSGVTGRFVEFMQMYDQSCLSNNENTHLVLAVFGEKDYALVAETVSAYREKYPDASITVLQGSGAFSRAKALDLGLAALQDNNLAFLCDVDMHMEVDFLSRCRRNTIQGQRVYYPEVFKLYNMDYVYRNQHKPRVLSISREHGHWGSYAFGMVCIYKSDYLSTGGFDVNMMGWGGEDVELYEKVIKTNLEVFRAPDVGLVHQWHPKNCTRHTSSKQYEQCMMSKAEVLADRRELAQYIFDLEAHIDQQKHTQ